MFQRGSHLLWQEKYRKIVWRVFVSGIFFVKTLANFFFFINKMQYFPRVVPLV